LNKLKIAKIGLVTVLAVALVASEFMVYNYALNVGYNTAVMSIADALKQAGAIVNITDLGDGRYQIHVHFMTSEGEAGEFSVPFELHMTVEQWRDGELVSSTYHAMSLTNLGKDWLEGIIGNAVGSDVAKYIACSNDSSSFSASWTAIPNEIATGGLARAAGTYASTGTGTWNITKTFSVTATSSTKLYGLYYASSGNYLLAAEQQGTANQKNLLAGDSLKITVQGSIS
jgi:hypothetical protein